MWALPTGTAFIAHPQLPSISQGIWESTTLLWVTCRPDQLRTADFHPYRTSVNQMGFYDNQQWFHGHHQTFHSRVLIEFKFHHLLWWDWNRGPQNIILGLWVASPVIVPLCHCLRRHPPTPTSPLPWSVLEFLLHTNLSSFCSLNSAFQLNFLIPFLSCSHLVSFLKHLKYLSQPLPVAVSSIF